MDKTVYHIPKMDCSSEEELIKMKLDGLSCIRQLQFDIPNRRLTLLHEGDAEEIDSRLRDLRLGSSRVNTEIVDMLQIDESPSDNSRALIAVLIINAAFFFIEMFYGWIAGSMGLIADSLDMMADASVYGLALYAAGNAAVQKKNVAKLIAYIQIFLALFGFAEVLRRFLNADELPAYMSMITVAALAMGANIASLYILQRQKSKEVHMRASMICTSSDVIVNFGVILAGILVHVFSSNKPDLIVGLAVFIVVLTGALRIMRIARHG